MVLVAPLVDGASLYARPDLSPRSLAATRPSDGSTAQRPVRVSHRHLRARACTLELTGERPVCKPELVDADSGASVSFWLDKAPSSVDEEQRRATLTFPQKVGAQEQQVELVPGRWRVTWEEAGLVRRLPVQESGLPVVELSTISGACERQSPVGAGGARREGCRLVSDQVTRRIGVRDEAKSKLSSRL